MLEYFLNRIQKGQSDERKDRSSAAGPVGNGKFGSFSAKEGAIGALALGAQTAGAIAAGALAIGAVAIGALAIGKFAVRFLTVGHARAGSLQIEELSVERLRIGGVEITQGMLGANEKGGGI